MSLQFEKLLGDVTVSTRSRNEWAAEAIEPGACGCTERSVEAIGGKSQVQRVKSVAILFFFFYLTHAAMRLFGVMGFFHLN